MSTRGTLEHGADFHIYEELLEGQIYLELSDCKNFEIERMVDGSVRVKIILDRHVAQAIAKIPDNAWVND